MSNEKPSPLIALNHIVKKYRIGNIENTVLKGITLSIHEGEMLAIVGASGSGKSTLMNIIGLLDKAESGLYCLKQRNVAGLSNDELATLRNQHIGFVFQQFHLLPRFTAAQNVALPLSYRNESPEQIERQVADALARVGMQPFAHHRPTQLSGGQQQRVAIARALVTVPHVILADEPTGALDSHTGNDIMRLFCDLHREGKTILLVTHDEHIAAQCERRITLADGQMIADSKS